MDCCDELEGGVDRPPGIGRIAHRLNKKHLGICYHAVREASAAKIWQVGFIKGEHNIADCLTKILSGTQLEKQIDRWTHRK